MVKGKAQTIILNMEKNVEILIQLWIKLFINYTDFLLWIIQFSVRIKPEEIQFLEVWKTFDIWDTFDDSDVIPC